MKRFLKKGYGMMASIVSVILVLCLVSGIGLVSAQGTLFLSGTINVQIVPRPQALEVEYLSPSNNSWVNDTVNSTYTVSGTNWTSFENSTPINLTGLYTYSTFNIPFKVTSSGYTVDKIVSLSTASLCIDFATISVNSTWINTTGVSIPANGTPITNYVIITTYGWSGNCSIILNWKVL